jgi:two-component system, OmpR family, sensor histidine kinase QseC
MPFGLRPPTSLVGRLFCACAMALVITMALVGALILGGLQWGGSYLTQQELKSFLEEIESSLVFDASGAFVRLRLNDDELNAMHDGLPKDIAFRIIDAASGAPITGSPDGPAMAILKRAPPDPGGTVQTIEHEGFKLLAFSKSLRSGTHNYVIQVARSERMMRMLRENDGKTAGQAAVFTSLLAVVAFGAMVLWTVRRMLMPVQAASEAAAAITPENLTARLDGRQLPSELRPLVTAFNSALHRLQVGYTVQQQFLLSAAHELKTPLSLLRGEIELCTIEQREGLLGDIDHMVRQVNQLLHLAEVSELHNFNLQSGDLHAVVREVMKFLARLADRHQVVLQLDAPNHSVVQRADASAVFVLVKNLAENAIFHAGESRLVTIALDELGIRVRDDGTGIDAADLPHVFNRFWRAPGTKRPGAGLGLAICAEICKAHGWTIHAENRQPGVEFCVRFADARR